MKNTVKKLLLLTLIMALFMTQTLYAHADDTKAEYDGKLISEGMMDIKYATQFTIEQFQGGYRLIRTTYIDEPTLIVPEGMSIPSDLEEGTQIIQLPVTTSYIETSNLTAVSDGIGAIEKVTLIGQDTTWRFQSILDQLESKHTLFVGNNSSCDYEMIAANIPQFALLNGFDEDQYTKLKQFGIPVIIGENTSEPGLFARMEWMRLLGVLFGMEEEAETYYEAQMAQIESIQSEENTGLIVGIGGFSASSGKYSTRYSGDFQADYVRFAGGIYNFSDLEPEKGGNATVTAEDFYLNFKDCDIIIWTSNIPDDGSMADLVKAYPSIIDFKAYQNNRIYEQANIFIQLGAANPAQVVSDIHTLLTSENPEVSTTFFEHVS